MNEKGIVDGGGGQRTRGEVAEAEADVGSPLWSTFGAKSKVQALSYL